MQLNGFKLTLIEWLQKALSSEDYNNLRTGAPLGLTRHKTTKILKEPEFMNEQTFKALHGYLTKHKRPNLKALGVIDNVWFVLNFTEAGREVIPFNAFCRLQDQHNHPDKTEEELTELKHHTH